MTHYTELQKAAAYAAQDTIKFADEDEEMRALQQFHEEVDPETVLALIAENERIQEAHEQICTNYNEVSYASEERGKQIDQLKAELEHTGYDHDLLRNERDQLKAENDAARKDLQNLRSDNAQLTYALKQQEQSYLVLRADRDRLKAESEALRDDIEQSQYDVNAWRNSEESVWIEVFNSEGDDPFISAITGQITVEQLALIQAEILEYREDYFEKGSGLYVFRCAHYQAHHDNVGMTEPAHWETDFESHSPFPWEEEGAAMGQGEQS